MTDIVERLRSFARMTERREAVLINEAAYEIERLQTEAGGVAMAAEQFGRIAERKMVADEIKRLRAALTLIASFKGKCLFSNTRGSDADQAYREGSHAAWEDAADIASAAVTSGDPS